MASHIRTDLFSKGLFFSLSLHLFWFFLLTPIVRGSAPVQFSGTSVFLGTILHEVDMHDTATGYVTGYNKPGFFSDFSRSTFFRKNNDAFFKPKSEATQTLKGDDYAKQREIIPKSIIESEKDVTFGVSDFLNYIENTDFAELKRISSREDVAGFIDLQVYLGAGGVVKSVRKKAGSGDPILDLYVIRKIHTAVFKKLFSQNEWINVRFIIK